MSGARLGCPLLTARLPCGTGEIRYRCFLPDLTEFAAPSCTGPNYQQSTSHLKNTSDWRLFHLQIQSGLNHSRYTPLAERGGFEPPVLFWSTHDFQTWTYLTFNLGIAITHREIRSPLPRHLFVSVYHCLCDLYNSWTILVFIHRPNL